MAVAADGAVGDGSGVVDADAGFDDVVAVVVAAAVGVDALSSR